MTNPQVKTRHLRNAVGLLADTVLATIPATDQVAAIDAMTERLVHVELPTWARRADDMITEMQEMLAWGDDCPAIVRELLTTHDMNP